MEEPFEDIRLLLLWALGLALIVGGVALAIWLITVVYTGLFHPTELPIINTVLDGVDKDASILNVLSRDGSVTIQASEAFGELAIAIVVLILLGTLGSIVHALISGGTRLIGKATDYSGGKKEQNPDSAG